MSIFHVLCVAVHYTEGGKGYLCIGEYSFRLLKIDMQTPANDGEDYHLDFW
jgi:hypothetical protein